MSRYTGNSCQKTAARIYCYLWCSNCNQGLSAWHSWIRNKIHIVIASQDCGDIEFLRTIGVPAKNIIACDKDAVARENAAKYKVNVSPYNDIVDTVRWAKNVYKNKIGSVNVDLCDSVITVAPILAQIRTIVGQNTYVYCTFLRGHDPGFAKDDERRLEYLGRPDAAIRYQSKRKNNHGSPMCVAIYLRQRDNWGNRLIDSVPETQIKNQDFGRNINKLYQVAEGLFD